MCTVNPLLSPPPLSNKPPLSRQQIIATYFEEDLGEAGRCCDISALAEKPLTDLAMTYMGSKVKN